jgi:acetyl-CoA acyltransferase
MTTAVNDTLTATGVKPEQIQKAWASNFAGELFSSQGHMGAALVGSNPALRFIPSVRVEVCLTPLYIHASFEHLLTNIFLIRMNLQAACASGGVAFNSAVNDIRGGFADFVLAAGAEAQNTVSPRVGGDYLARASHYARQRKLDEFTFPALFARRMKAYREAHGRSEKDIAHTSVKAYANGNLNPLAHMTKVKMTLENASVASDRNPNFLANPELKPWLKTSDCSQVSDGGSAVILVSEAGLAAMGKKPSDVIEVLASEVSTDNLYAVCAAFCHSFPFLIILTMVLFHHK